jgi:hypothetical protein
MVIDYEPVILKAHFDFEKSSTDRDQLNRTTDVIFDKTVCTRSQPLCCFSRQHGETLGDISFFVRSLTRTETESEYMLKCKRGEECIGFVWTTVHFIFCGTSKITSERGCSNAKRVICFPLPRSKASSSSVSLAVGCCVFFCFLRPVKTTTTFVLRFSASVQL